MEIWNSSVVVAVGLYIVIILVWRRRGRGKGVPPGSMGWPVLGETLHLITAFKTSHPDPFADSRRLRYGSRVFKTHLLGNPTIFSADAEMNNFVLQKEGTLFRSSYPKSLGSLLGKHSLLITPHGVLHKKLHSLLWANFSTSTILQHQLMPSINNLIHSTLLSWHSHPPHHTLYLQDQAKKMTFNLSLSQLLSVNPSEWTEGLRHHYLKLINGFFSLPIKLPGTTYTKALQARSVVVKELKQVVRKRRKEEDPSYNDLLSCLLKDDTCLSDEHIVDIIVSLLVAGYETTSMVITLAVYYLTHNHRALAQLRAEQCSIKSKKEAGEELEWKDYKSMSFTHCVINETLRLGNTVGGVFRKAICQVETNGYVIPKDWSVFVSFRAVHLDADLYGPDARTFNPWRWKGKKQSCLGATFFTPFGGGPRFCPGYELARLEIAIFLHHFVTLFRWEVAEPDHPIFFPTTRMAQRFPIHLTKL